LNEELQNRYSSSTVHGTVKSRNMELAGHGARVRNEKFVQTFGRKMKGRDHLGDLGVDEKIILKCLRYRF
jgi:hypothetical protein